MVLHVHKYERTYAHAFPSDILYMSVYMDFCG